MSPLLELRGLGRTFRAGGREVHALRDVSLALERGECLAVVGESGSGKSTLANLALGVLAPSAGEVAFDGAVLPARRTLAQRRLMQLVQQNPAAALNPRRSVGASLRLPLDVHGIGVPSERPGLMMRLLEDVGLDPALAARRPDALSGGQRQRVAIARALACESPLLVLDEPTSALDVLVQARVLRLLADLRACRGLTYLFITHDLAVVRAVADRVAVLDAGRLVEVGSADAIFAAPSHPRTRALMAAVPVVTGEEAAMRDALARGAV